MATERMVSDGQTEPIILHDDLLKYLWYLNFLGELKCEFCENVTSISLETNDVDMMEKVTNNEIFTMHQVDGYYNHSIQFDHIRNLFASNGRNMDESICKIFLNDQYTKMSEYFQLTEQEVNEKNLSIGW